MKHIILLFALGSLLVGCAHMCEYTIARGIDYGMTQEQVLAHLERSQKVVTRDNSKIVTEGYDSA